MSLLVDAVSWLCLILGGAFVLVAGVGVIRLPDVFTRLHAAGIADSLGALLILLGLMLQSGLDLESFKLLLLLAFFLLTGPTSTHALAVAALRDPTQCDIRPLPENEDDPSSNN